MKNQKIIRVRDVMKTDFATIEGVSTISEAVRVMKEQKTSVLIVNKRDEDDEYGLILAGDIARHVLAKDRSPERVNVYEIMTKPIISMSPEMDIRYCSRMFARYNLVRAPVLEHRVVIGTVSPISLVLDGLYNIC
ncbi:MAG: histidine kinase [Gammaproteobacteria bacterium]|nr:MAG: histidine kinase [Gammaproteobacteria bacterium]RLA23534.1 MAG: histidine kinase [Gammaproteobacteria bacterium]